MTYSDAIKSGFKLVHKNWQLILTQLGMIIISCISFLIFVGIPLAVAFVIFGLDFTELTRFKDILGTMSDPSEILSRYTGLIIIFLISFMFYLLVVASIGLYVFGGSASLIGRTIRDYSLRFNMNTFFSEGSRLFFPLVGFTAIIGLIFIGVAFLLGILGGVTAVIINIAREDGTTLPIFIGIFLALLLICIGIILIICTIALTLYGVAAIIFKGIGPLKSTKETIRYLYHHPDALWLYFIAFVGYILASFLLILLGAPFNMIPIAGAIIAIPYQLFSYTVQSYLGLVIISTTFIYYYSTEISPHETESKIVPIAESSTQMSDISPTQVLRQEPPPPEKESPH